jgi:hypothetical protein
MCETASVADFDDRQASNTIIKFLYTFVYNFSGSVTDSVLAFAASLAFKGLHRSNLPGPM